MVSKVCTAISASLMSLYNSMKLLDDLTNMKLISSTSECSCMTNNVTTLLRMLSGHCLILVMSKVEL